MAMTPEAKVKKVVTKQLKQLGAFYFYPVTGGWGRGGIPDIIGCYKGHFFGIECKAGKNAPTFLQFKSLQDIRKAGGLSLIVNENNMTDVSNVLNGIDT
jgi:Holliday junction resolvase